MTVQTYQLPFDVPLPPCRLLSAGSLKCMYEKGNLRYIYSGEAEVVRMMYPAIRDENWETLEPHITDEVIEENEGSFLIKYTATYQGHQISYKAFFEIEGADNTISFSMKGVALKRFPANRIGICIHHSIPDCAGKKVAIQSPDGITYESNFPVQINPHQPFKSVRQMQWPVRDGVDALLHFEGDVFQTEDQRNWTDASYKTYSRLLELPFPFWVSEKETMEQKVTLKVITDKEIIIPIPQTISSNEEIKIPFPKTGYCRKKGSPHLTANEIQLLKKLPFDHYRVEVKMDGARWEEELITAFSEARQLLTKLEVIVFFSDNAAKELRLLIQKIQHEQDYIAGILVLHNNYSVTPDSLLEYIYPLLKNALPLVKVGYGTDANFAELNRNRPAISSFDFVSYSINPQVHASDTRSLLENLQAQTDTIKTARTFAGSKAIHISPVTLKKRGIPSATNPLPDLQNDATASDTRQHTWLAAYWTLQTIKNLGEAASLTFYEATGNKGLLKELNPSSEIQVAREDTLTPVYKVLAAIKSFGAIWLIRQNSDTKTSRNRLLLQNQEGNRLEFMIERPSAELISRFI